MRFPYIPRGDGEEKQMLDAIGVSSFADLVKSVPDHLKLKDDLDIAGPMSEYQIERILGDLAARNLHSGNALVFLGAGSYDHFVPAVIDHVSYRSEFYTAYTPYQAEVGQGTLTTIFEFQTMMAALTGMDLANASLYDGASALAEAALLAVGVTGRKRIVVAGPLHPHYLAVLQTFCQGQEIQVFHDPAPDGVIDRAWVRDSLNETAAVVAQSPNFFGAVEDLTSVFEEARDKGVRTIHVFEPHALAIYKTPAEMGADLAVGEGLSLGTAPLFGGPALGLFAARQEFVRQVPGRLVGETLDKKGNRVFVMTLRTREQDIRRERATSNICTNQALLALRATLYMSLLGPAGMVEVAQQCLDRAHYVAEKMEAVDGYRRPNQTPFFHEFVLECPRPAVEVIDHARSRGVIPGIPLDRYFPTRAGDFRSKLLVCVTEKHTKDDLDALVEVLQEAGRG